MRLRVDFFAVTLLMTLFAVALSGCDRAGGAREIDPRSAAITPEAQAEAVHRAGSPASELVVRLNELRKRGQFEAFTSAALDASAAASAVAPVRILAVEALLASGQDEAADDLALETASLALAAQDTATAGQSLRLWTVARFRQSKPLADERFVGLLRRLPAADALAELPRFWLDALGDKVAYRVEATDGHSSSIGAASGPAGSLAAELSAIEARANGVTMPLVFIDTGAQHNLMTVEAARRAGVALGSSSTHLVGFAGLNARPGVIRTLELGGIALHDVPVLVGQPKPLVSAGGQMTLGIELMHHVRFTIDYPLARVSAVPAIAPAVRSIASWEIPVWTFSQACLAQLEMPSGQMGRALVDTGDRRGTYVSRRWARRNVPGFARPDAGLVFKFKPRDLVIDEMKLGSRPLEDWRVFDTLPAALEKLDLVDVLLGHDLLSRYQLTIDLRRRVFELSDREAASSPESTNAAVGLPTAAED
jgi:Aspartyl protease